VLARANQQQTCVTVGARAAPTTPLGLVRAGLARSCPGYSRGREFPEARRTPGTPFAQFFSMSFPSSVSSNNRPLALLQELLELPAIDARESLTAAATSVARWLACDKTDVFLFDETRSSLVAMGTSQTPLGELQRLLGLDVMALAQGGRSVQVFQTGRAHLDGHVEEDAEELRGIVRELGVRSQVTVPLQVAGVRRGVLSLVSQQPERFDEADLQLVELVGGWMSTLVHRAELGEKLREEERERARRMAADEIISVLAHDIWNHLNPLSARLQLLQMKLARQEPVLARDLDSALLAAQRLARLTQDLLDTARLEHGLFELELTPVELTDLVSDVARLCASPGIDVRVDAPAKVTAICDGNRLRQALENVVMNAVRYSPRGSSVTISVVPESEAGTVVVRVADRGPGIEPELLPHLFDRFVAKGPSKGLGLGLYLAKRIALAHGGTLAAHSQVGAGAEFSFTLPVEGPPLDGHDGTAARLRP
jgi:two-component system, OmpR family, sensor kinase